MLALWTETEARLLVVSPALDLLKPTQEKDLEEQKKVYVGKIPKGVSDTFMERLLKICGPVASWKRSTDANGEPRGFGFCEYEEVESMLVCLKVMNNLNLFDSRLIVPLALQNACLTPSVDKGGPEN